MSRFFVFGFSETLEMVKWRSKEEQRIQTLDLALKILVPLILSAWLVISLKVGSFDGYLQLLSRRSFGSPLMALGAGFTLAYLAFQLVRTILWLRYKSYPIPPGQLPRVTVIIPAYNEGAMVEKSIYAAVASGLSWTYQHFTARSAGVTAGNG